MKEFRCQNCKGLIKPPEIENIVISGAISSVDVVFTYKCPNCGKPYKTTEKDALQISEIIVKQDKTGKC